MKPKNYLLIFTIGPVQSFIAQARKTRDLHAGSLMLSSLCRKAALKAMNSYGGKIIYPHEKLVKTDDPTVPLPNRFVAIVDNENAGKEIQTEIEMEFKTMLVNGILGGKKVASFQNQIDHFLQIYWASIPFEKNKYTDSYQQLSKYIGAVKNTRIFQQSNSPGRKCSLCGERTALFYFSSKNVNRYFISDAVNLRIDKKATYVDMTEGEGLCAICQHKRFSKFKDAKGNPIDFFSTAKIALLDAMPAKQDPPHIKKYKNIFSDYYFDEQLFFEENLTDHYFEKHHISKKLKEKAIPVQREIVNEIRKEEKKMHRYYTLIMLDGDDMGKWLAGKWLKDIDKLQEFHKFMTEELGNYAIDVRINHIKNDVGKLVYAGGDDVLTFVNLEYLFQVVCKLFDQFPTLENRLVEDYKKATPSCGIIIAHYKTPLSEVMKWARAMNKKAKSLDDKHAIGIAAITHSGSITQSVFKYKHFATMQEVFLKLKQEISDSFISKFKDEFYRVFDKQSFSQDENERYIEMIKTELTRLMKRSMIIKSKDLEEKIDDIVENNIKDLLFDQFKQENSNYCLDIANVISFFEITRFLASKTTK